MLSEQSKTAICVCVLASVWIVTLSSRLHLGLAPQDEGQLLVYPDLILRGYVPYRDFAAMYGPATFYSIASMFSIFGPGVLTERMIGVSYQIGIGIVLYALGSRISWRVGAFAALSSLTMTLLFPLPGAYAMFGATTLSLGALYCASRHCESSLFSQKTKWATWAGVLSGLVFLYRWEVGVIATSTASVAMGPQLLRRSKSFLIGLSIPTLSLILFACLVGPGVMFDSLVLDPMRNTPGRRLPLHWDAGFAILLVCTAFNVVHGLLIRERHGSFHLVWLVRSISLWSIGASPLWLQRMDSWHEGYIGASVVGLFAVSASIAARYSKIASREYLSLTQWAAVAVLIYFCVRFMFVSKELAAYTVSIHGNGRTMPVFLSKEDSADLQPLVDDLNRASRCGERIFIGPSDLRFAVYNDTFLYYLFPCLRPAARYLEMNPGSANRSSSGLAEQIRFADWIILTSVYEGWNEPNTSSVPGPTAPNEVIKMRFCLHAVHGPRRILHRCKRTKGLEN